MSSTLAGIVFLASLVLSLALVHVPLGDYMYRVYSSERDTRVERIVYRAIGADPRAGDGAGILVQIPHAFFARKTSELGFKLPQPGEYAIGALFMPRDAAWRNVIKSIIADEIKNEGFKLLGWRDVPSDNSSLDRKSVV